MSLVRVHALSLSFSRTHIAACARVAAAQHSRAANGKIEDMLTDIVVSIAVFGEAQLRQSEASHHVWLLKRRAENEAEIIRRRLEAERLAEERRLKAQAERRERLFSQAHAWRNANDIRGFVADVLRAAADDPGLEAWAAWAKAEADALDPTLNGDLTASDISGTGD